MTRLVRNTTIYAVGDILPKIFSFITFPVLTSFLTPSEYGIINYVNTLNIFLVIFSVLCLNTYYLVFYFRQENEEARKRLLGNLSVFILGVTLVFSLFFLGVGYFWTDASHSGISFYPYIAIGIAINFFNVFSILPLATYRVQENPLPLTVINVAKGALIMLLTLLLVVRFEYKSLGVLSATLIVNIFFAVWFFIITCRKAVFCFDWCQIKQALFFSLPLVPGAMAYYLVSMSDRLLIEKYAGLTELGIYSTASTLALLLNIISMGAYKAFEPYFFRIYGSDSFLRQFSKVHDTFFLILLVGALGLALFSKEFLEIMSSESYHSAYLYVPMLLVGVLASSMTLLYGTVLTAREKTKINSLISIVGGGCSVLLNIILLPLMGIRAACFTSMICFIGMMLAALLCSGIRISWRRPVASLAMAIAVSVYPIYVMEIDNVALSLAVKVVVFVVMCLLVIRLMNFNLKKIYGTLLD